MSKVKLVYDSKYISKEEIEKIDINNQLDLQETSIPYDRGSMMSLFSPQILFALQDIGKGVIENIIAAGIVQMGVIIWKKYKKNKVQMVDSCGKKEYLSPAILLNSKHNQYITVILNREKPLSIINYLNLGDILNHIEEGRYICFLDDDGRLQIFTELEYAQHMHDKQEKSKK